MGDRRHSPTGGFLTGRPADGVASPPGEPADGVTSPTGRPADGVASAPSQPTDGVTSPAASTRPPACASGTPCASPPGPSARTEGAPGDGAAELPAEAFAVALAGLPGMGPSRLAALLAAAPPSVAWAQVTEGHAWSDARLRRALGPVPTKVTGAWRQAAGHVDLADVWQRLLTLGIAVDLLGSATYPSVLAGDVEPPAVLFHQGTTSVIDGPRVAIVGTRRCSSTGVGLAFELGRDLAAAGVAVVSGLAAGIDGAAHRGARAADGAPPIGVVGSGLDVVYPRGQTTLWRAVADAGVLLSEAPPGAAPSRWRFPARNRIIAALADLVIVVESHRRGGSLHTVDEADRRAIDVLAVPGSVRNPAAAGTNELLAEGRAPVCSVDDVLVALGLGAGRRGGPSADRRAQPEATDRPVLEAVGWQPATLDHLVLRTGLDLGRLALALDRLCAAGWVARHGGWYERVAAPAGAST
jgi:DNA processing protein